MTVKDMIFNRETENRIYNAAYTLRSDGNAKVNDTAFCCVYLDTSSLNEPTTIITTYDKITKVQTDGTAQQLSSSEAKECKAVYISDNKVLYAYADAATGALYARVGNITGTVASFGTESTDLTGGTHTAQHFDLCKIDNTHFGIIGIFYSVADLYPVTCALVFEIAGDMVSDAGDVLELAERLSPVGDGSQFQISALDSTSIGVVYWEDINSNTYTVKLDISSNNLVMNQTPLLLVENFITSNPGIAVINTNLAFVGFTPTDRPATYNTLALLDYSGTIPVILQYEDFATTSNATWKWAVISTGSIIVVLDKYDIFEVSIMVVNLYGRTFQINYTEDDTFFNNRECFGVQKINQGEVVFFLDELTFPGPTIYNVDSVLCAFLGGVSMPDFIEYDNVEFGIAEVGSYQTEEINLINDGLYPENIDMTCSSFYFADDNNLLSRSASIRVNSLQILNNEHYDYLKDPKGNILQAVI